MPKQKTHKGTAKRIKKTGSGKLMHRRPFGGHFLSKKSAARKRGYSGLYELKGSSKQNMKRRLGE
jgi:large subunit ribosomal protein L35